MSLSLQHYPQENKWKINRASNRYREPSFLKLKHGLFILPIDDEYLLFKNDQGILVFIRNISELANTVEQVITINKHYFASHTTIYDQNHYRNSYQLQFGKIEQSDITILKQEFVITQPANYIAMKGVPLWHHGQLIFIEFQKGFIGVLQQRSIRPAIAGEHQADVSIVDLQLDERIQDLQITLPENISIIRKLKLKHYYFICGIDFNYLARIKYSTLKGAISFKLLKRISHFNHHDKFIDRFLIFESFRTFNNSTKNLQLNPYTLLNQPLSFLPFSRIQILLEQDCGRMLTNYIFPKQYHKERNPLGIFLLQSGYMIYNTAIKTKVSQEFRQLKSHWFRSIMKEKKIDRKEIIEPPKQDKEEEKKVEQVAKEEGLSFFSKATSLFSFGRKQPEIVQKIEPIKKDWSEVAFAYDQIYLNQEDELCIQQVDINF